MITLKKYIEQLQDLLDQGFDELPLIYSSDDEGNSYHKINNLPELYRVEDINEYYLESDFAYDDNDEILEFKPNCIIIN